MNDLYLQQFSRVYIACDWFYLEEILRDVLNLDVSKACQDTDIPSKIIKENADIFTSFLHSSFNTSVTNSELSSVLRQANITLVFKKGERYFKDNYRQVSILPNVSI